MDVTRFLGGLHAQKVEEEFVEGVEDRSGQALVVHPAAEELRSQRIHRCVDTPDLGNDAALAGYFFLDEEPAREGAEFTHASMQLMGCLNPRIVCFGGGGYGVVSRLMRWSQKSPPPPLCKGGQKRRVLCGGWQGRGVVCSGWQGRRALCGRGQKRGALPVGVTRLAWGSGGIGLWQGRVERKAM